MFYLRFIFALVCVMSTSLNAEESNFSTHPNECIASEKGEICTMTLSLIYPQLPAGEFCLAINQRALNCWPRDKLPMSFNIALSTDSTLTLNDRNGINYGAINLNIKYRKASTHRRRVRNPWSVF